MPNNNIKGEKEMKELININNGTTNYINILKKLARIKDIDRSHMEHVESKFLVDSRSTSPRRAHCNNDIPMSGSTQLNMFG